MEIVQNSILEQSIELAISYADYRAMVSNLVVEGKSTGPNQSEALANYTLLNHTRMQRLDKTIKISEGDSMRIKNFGRKVTWLVITESWCGDAAQSLPVINKIAEISENIDLKMVLRDENEGLMNMFLTNGSKSIPKLVMVDDETGDVLDTWGPRPSVATKMVEDLKTRFGVLTADFKQDLQLWYNKDKGQSTIEDLLQLLPLE